MTKFNDVIRLPEFERDLKRLLKKYRTLEEDLQIFIRIQLVLYHKLHQENGGIFRIPRLQANNPPIFKAKKFACRALKGTGCQSGIRLIYSYESDLDKIVFIEIYYKGEKENEDRDRIGSFLKSCQSERR